MAYVAQFNIIGAYTDLALKQITIETNFKIDPSSVTMDNIKLYKVNKESEEHTLVFYYSLSVDETGKKIIVQFDNYPENDTRYYIIVKSLIDKLGRTLYSNYDKYVKFQYNIKTKVSVNYPSDQAVLKDNNIEFKIATTCEDEEIKYRIEISHDVAFFKSNYILLSDKESFISNDLECSLTKYEISDSVITGFIQIKRDGQYYFRVRAEKTEDIAGQWSDAVSFSVTTAKSAIQDSSGFLDDFLYSDVLYEEELDPLEELSSSESAITSQQFFIEFNKDIEFNEDELSQYSNDGLLYIGKAYMIRRDL